MRIDENTALSWGIGMVTVGGLVTLSTYVSGGPANSYVVTAGLLVVGAISLIRGIYLHLKPRSRA